MSDGYACVRLVVCILCNEVCNKNPEGGLVLEDHSGGHRIELLRQVGPGLAGATYRAIDYRRMSPAPFSVDSVELAMGGVRWGLGKATVSAIGATVLMTENFTNLLGVHVSTDAPVTPTGHWRFSLEDNPNPTFAPSHRTVS